MVTHVRNLVPAPKLILPGCTSSCYSRLIYPPVYTAFSFWCIQAISTWLSPVWRPQPFHERLFLSHFPHFIVWQLILLVSGAKNCGVIFEALISLSLSLSFISKYCWHYLQNRYKQSSFLTTSTAPALVLVNIICHTKSFGTLLIHLPTSTIVFLPSGFDNTTWVIKWNSKSARILPLSKTLQRFSLSPRVKPKVPHGQ